jgi:hypothetical protein
MGKLASLFVMVALCYSSELLAQPPISVPLRNPRAAVVSTYAQLSSQPVAQRRSLYTTLPSTMQEDLWTLHLANFLADHPDLLPAERALVHEALGLVQSGILEVDPSSAEWHSGTLVIAHRLEARTRQGGSALLVEAFTRLGGPDVVDPASRAREPRTDISIGGECECNTTHDFCCFGDCPTSPSPNCRRNRRSCIAAHGCGLFWLDDCNGLCGS